MATKTPIALFTTDKGRTFTARVLPVGARYGVHNMLTADTPTVEFYDTMFADDGAFARSGFGPLGQFVTRYNIASLLGIDGYGDGDGPCIFDDGTPVWRIDAETMKQVRAWLRERLAKLIHLTPANTYTAYQDALAFTHNWAICQTVELVGDDDDLDGKNPVTSWRVKVIDNEEPSPDRVWHIGHEDFMRALVRVAADPKVQIVDEIVRQFQAVANAADNEGATDAMCQPDCIGYDAVMQVATIGNVIYG